MKSINTIIIFLLFITAKMFSQTDITATDLYASFSPNISIAVAKLSVMLLNPTATSIRVDRTGTATDLDVPTVWLVIDKNKNDVFDAGDSQLGTTQNFSGGTAIFSGLNYMLTTNENVLIVFDVASNADVSNTTGLFMGTDYIQGALGTVSFNGIATGNKPLPVELVSFAIKSVKENSVVLGWETATEINNYGFNVERNMQNGLWTEIGFVQGHGNSNSPKNYTFTDNNVYSAGKYSYRLKQIDFDGTYEYSEIVAVDISNAAVSKLMQNYPNPFNPETVITYKLSNAGQVTLKIYDMLGKEVTTLVNGNQNSGLHHVSFSNSNFGLSTGVYFYELKAGNFSEMKKMLFLK